jgi:capsular exopolysaccharide synthesis family protein
MSTIERAVSQGNGETPVPPSPRRTVRKEAVNSLEERISTRRRPLAGRCDFDIDAMAARGFLSPKEGRSQLAREMRRIKRPLLLNIRKAEAIASRPASLGTPKDLSSPNFIMVTSALPGEGKTYTSTNLAISIAAEIDRSALLVDADVAKRDLSRQFDLSGYAGLTEALADPTVHPDAFTLGTSVERLELLPSGSVRDNIDELFSSVTMHRRMRSLSRLDSNRVVVFDGPPLLVTTEAKVLAQYMYQIVLVVESGKSPQDAVLHALKLLEDHPNVSVLLNKTSRPIGSDYGYGYGYGYGHGEEEADR